MFSVLVGVAAAAGGHLLWLNPPGPDTTVALPDDADGTTYDTPLRRAEPGSASPSASTAASPTASSPPPERTTTGGAAPPEPAPTSSTESTETTTERTTTGTSSRDPGPTSERPGNTARSETSAPTSTSGGPLTTQVVTLVNAERADAGCAPVTVDSRLTTAAQAHSDDMARRGYLEHTTPEGVTFDQRIRRAGYPRPAAENIAMGLSSADAVMDAWMSSEGHRRNILNCDISAIGVGVNSSGWYWTQNFGY